jgi:hypothetical protein
MYDIDTVVLSDTTPFNFSNIYDRAFLNLIIDHYSETGLYELESCRERLLECSVSMVNVRNQASNR